MSIRERVARLLSRLPRDRQFPSQGKTLFVDLERREIAAAYLPRRAIESFLDGRGGNMFLLWHLLDERLEPLSPEIPLIFGSGLLTGLVPSAARGNCTSWSPDSGVLMDSNCGDYFPSFQKLHGYDHLVLYGRARELVYLRIAFEDVSFGSAECWRGLNNLDLRPAIERRFGGKERKDLAIAAITRAGENLVLCSGIMGGPKAIYARGGPGAKMGSLNLKAIVVHGKPRDPPMAEPAEFKPANARIAKKLLSTSVIRNALKNTGTPFLYKPSRLLGAMGTKNNQETTWVETLDARFIDPYRSGMDGCFRCPVNCRPQNDMTPEGPGGFGAGALEGRFGQASYQAAGEDHAAERALVKKWRGREGDGRYDRYDKGDGPEYVTLGKFGPNIGIAEVEHVLRLNNICNDLGLDTASTGSAIGWAMELWQRGLIDAKTTGGIDLSWGNFESVEKLLFLCAERKGFGGAIADSARAVERGWYPEEALRYRMSIKGLFQSDPHDARILKAFALGLAVATRGSDHLRNRVTLEINARVNDDPEFKRQLYGGAVSKEPASYEGKEIAVRRCENLFAVGDAVGMCRFTTKLFNSPHLPSYEEFAEQIAHVCGLDMPPERLDAAGLRINALERLLNYRLGVRKADDTLPERWFDEPVKVGAFRGEKIDRAEFERLRERFYRISRLDEEGRPDFDFRGEILEVLEGFSVPVRIPRELAAVPGGGVHVTRPVRTVGELLLAVAEEVPGFAEKFRDSLWNVAVNGELVLHGLAEKEIRSGDHVEIVPVIAGG
jgi:aldehyde:ferredoxin oxidoreductase